jgi:glycosyltransferase family protein
MKDTILKKKLICLYEGLYEKYRIFSLQHRYGLRIMNADRTIRYILRNQCSIARFGEGEFGHIIGKGYTYFQPNSSKLSVKLKEALCNHNEKLLLCVPICINTYHGLNDTAKAWWTNWGKSGRQETIAELIGSCVGRDYLFGDAMLTRPYMDWKSRRRAARLFRKIKLLWQNRDLLIIEGEQTRLGVGNDLFSNAKSIKRILAPAVGAFDCYDEIMASFKKHYHGELILLALGPTATIMASELANLGCQALDIGHIDIEYEWYLRGATQKTVIEGKFVNEIVDGRSETNCENKTYIDQIVDRVMACH